MKGTYSLQAGATLHAGPVQVSQNQSAQTQRVEKAHPLLEAPPLFLSRLSLTVQLLQGQAHSLGLKSSL